MARRVGSLRLTVWWCALLSISIAGCLSENGLDPPAPGAWTIAVLPDTQYYARDYPDIFVAQTQWLASAAGARRIAFVLHEGDITNDNVLAQWTVARSALQKLHGVVPYVLATGNHDYGVGGDAASRDTLLNDFFPLAEAQLQGGFGGAFEPNRIDNTYWRFDTPNGPFLVVSLEFGPRDNAVLWADQVLASNPDTTAIVLTHAYLYWDNTRYDYAHRHDQLYDPWTYGVANAGVNDGEQLFNALIVKHPHVRFVLSGHVLGDGLGYLKSTRPDGSIVHQILANYQSADQGGSGYLRLLEIVRDQVHVRTYSPYLDLSLIDPTNDFVIPLHGP